MRPDCIATHACLAALTILVSACSDRTPAHQDRDLTLPPLRPAPPSETIPSVNVPSSGRCVPLAPGPVRLTGTLEQQERLGPPGYGESPDKDERLTIYLLDLSERFKVCALDDRARVSGAVHQIKVVQLTGNLDPHRITIGIRVSVFGTVAYQELSHDFTEIVLRVDSIPALRPPRPGTST